MEVLSERSFLLLLIIRQGIWAEELSLCDLHELIFQFPLSMYSEWFYSLRVCNFFLNFRRSEWNCTTIRLVWITFANEDGMFSLAELISFIGRDEISSSEMRWDLGDCGGTTPTIWSVWITVRQWGWDIFAGKIGFLGRRRWNFLLATMNLVIFDDFVLAELFSFV